VAKYGPKKCRDANLDMVREIAKVMEFDLPDAAMEATVDLFKKDDKTVSQWMADPKKFEEVKQLWMKYRNVQDEGTLIACPHCNKLLLVTAQTLNG
jgi:hypothetical protein